MGPESSTRLTAEVVADDFPRGEFGLANRLGYRLMRAAAFLTVRPYFRLRVTGHDLLPARGPLIIAPNHRSHIDPLVLQTAVTRRRIVFVMMRDWYDRPRLRLFFRYMHCIALEESGSNRRALDLASGVLERGGVLGMFPEGRLVTDTPLAEFSPGVAMLAMRTGAPIVPTAILGSDAAFPRGRRFPARHPIEVRFGEPIVTAADSAGRREKLKDVTTRLHAAVGTLLSTA